ncbi:kinase-like domain-containing protein [Tanacetum coccineum]
MKSSQKIIYLSSSSRISFLFYGLSIICLTFATVSASYGGNETDYHALLSFKSKITQDPHKVLTSWNHSFHFCEWSGISCGKRHKRVTILRLDSQGLEGSLSPHVGNLSFLRTLSIRNNSFQGTIPHELGRLARLRVLYLDKNKFSGLIPSNLSRCSNLEVLWLGENKLAGSIPKEMSLLSKLVGLVIEVNKLTGGIPPFLGNITSMEIFSAAGNSLGGSFPETLGLWKSLTEFYCGGCNLYGSIPHSIFNLSLLDTFSFYDNQLTGSLPSKLGVMLPNLELLQLSGPILDAIGNLSLLNKLFLASNELEGLITSSIGKCTIIVALAGVHWPLQRYTLNGTFSMGEVPVVGVFANASAFSVLGNNRLCGGLVTLELPKCKEIGSKKKRDVATALDYLHIRCQTAIVHGGLKPSNILLDADMVAHVGDFGLARLLVVMTGKNPTDGMFNEGLSLHKFAYMALRDHVIDVIVDAMVLQSTEANAKKVEECMAATINIGVSCSVDSPPQRMKIEIVVTELQRIVNVYHQACMAGEVENNCNNGAVQVAV